MLEAVRGDYIPRKEELERHERNLLLLDTLPIDSPRYDEVYKEVVQFESKYC